MLKNLFSEIHWRRIVLAGIAVVVLDIILDLLLLFLATHIWSQSAQTAYSVSSWTTYILLLLCTFIAAFWVATKVEREAPLNGALVGLVIGLALFLVSRGFGTALLSALVTLVLNLAAGYLGGAFGGRGRETS